jgi:hypothetical protein
MKQGTGNCKPGQQKAEPKTHAISVDKVANMGAQIVRTYPPHRELYKGRGFEAPVIKSQTKPKGSQGSY